MLKLSCAVFSTVTWVGSKLQTRDERGQATAEYTIVLLMVSVVAFVATKIFGTTSASNPITSLIGVLLKGLLGSAGTITKLFL